MPIRWPTLVMFLLWAFLVLLASAHAATVRLAWDCTGGCAQATQFKVYRQVGCTGPFVVSPTGTLLATQLTYDETALIAGTTYCWEVTALNSAGEESGPSNLLSFRLPNPPQAPSGLRYTIVP